MVDNQLRVGVDGEGTYPYAGLTRFDDGEVPDGVWGHGSSMFWWAAERGGTDEPDAEHLPRTGLNTLADTLPTAALAEAGWKHPVTGEWHTTEKHNAVIEPEKAEAFDQPDEALYTIPTDEYEIINPRDFLGPLIEVIQQKGYEDSVFGEVRVSRGGGRVSMDVLFDGMHVEAPGMDEDRKPIVIGLQIDYGFFGDTAVNIRGIGMDYECVNSLRQVTDPETIKHAGDVESRVDWIEMFEDLLTELDLKTDQIARLIEEASNERLDLSDFPPDFAEGYDSILEAVYAYAGFPDYLAEVAADNARANAVDPFDPDWWTLHRGATYAISHEARGEVGHNGSIDRYHRVANDFLSNPAEMGDRIVEAYHDAKPDDSEQDTLAEESGGAATVAGAFDSVSDKREQYEERQEQIRTLVQDS
jgi:hypothetical protein